MFNHQNAYPLPDEWSVFSFEPFLPDPADQRDTSSVLDGLRSYGAAMKETGNLQMKTHTEAPFPLPHGRGDEFHRGPSAPDPRDARPKGLAARDIYIPDLHIDRLKVRSRDFR